LVLPSFHGKAHVEVVLMAQEIKPPEPKSRRAIRWLDYGAMAALVAVIIYRFFLPHPSGPLPAPGTVAVETHGKPVLVDISSTT
jgi:hypothetical protein